MPFQRMEREKSMGFDGNVFLAHSSVVSPKNSKKIFQFSQLLHSRRDNDSSQVDHLFTVVIVVPRLLIPLNHSFLFRLH